MRRAQVSSSMIASIGYDPRKRILEIKFVHGRIYQYLDVDLSTFKELEGAPSKGTFFNTHIKDEYACVRIA